MVNIKTVRLPIILGMIKYVYGIVYTTRDSSCSFTINENYEVIGSAECDETYNGYYITEGKLFKYTNSQTSSINNNPLPGYYINTGTNVNNRPQYIKCTDTGCTEINSPLPTTCNRDNNGKLISITSEGGESEIQFCTMINSLDITNNKLDPYYTGIKFTENGEYFVSHNEINEVFNFDRSVDNTYYKVKTTPSSLILDVTYKVEDHCSRKDGSIMDRLTDFCSSESSGTYYTCTNGKCNSESQLDSSAKNTNEHVCDCTPSKNEKCKTDGSDAGYYYYDGEGDKKGLYSFISSQDCEKKTDSSMISGYYWNKFKYNDISKCNGETCDKISVSVVTSNSCDGKTNEIIDSGYNLLFCVNSNLSPILINDIKGTHGELVVAGKTSTLFADENIYYFLTANDISLVIDEDINGNFLYGKMILVCDNGKCTDNSGKSGYYLNYAPLDGEERRLIYCYNNECGIETEDAGNGYFFNEGSSDVIKCTDSECKIENYNNISSCTNSNPFAFDNSKLKFCDGTTEKDLPTTIDAYDYYLIANAKENEINYPESFTTDGGKSTIIIKVSRFSVIQHVLSTGICIDESTHKQITCTNDTNMYTCNSKDVKCEVKKATTCKPESDNANDRESCDGYYLTEEDNSLTLRLCSPNADIQSQIDCVIDTSIGYFKDSSDETKYISCIINSQNERSCSSLEKPTDDNKDCSKAGDVISRESSSKILLCVDDDGDHAVEIFKTGVLGNHFLETFVFDNSQSSQVYEAIAITEKSVMEKNINDGTYLNIKEVMICKTNRCTKTSSVGVYVNSAATGNDKKKLIVCEQSNQCSIGDDATIGYYINGAASTDAETKKLINCNENSCDLESTDANGGYYVNGFEAKKLIICDSTKCNSAESQYGHYINAADSKKLIFCDHKACTAAVTNSDLGYYLNAAATTNDNSRYLIHCNEDQNGSNRVCFIESNAASNGYYVNDGTRNSDDAVICDNSNCRTCSLDSQCDSGYKFIYNSDTNGQSPLKYCDNANSYDKTNYDNKETYYVVNVDGETDTINYPESYMNEDNSKNTENIILKINKYSISQVITGNEGSCISNGAIESECSHANNKYVCSTFTSGCTSSITDLCKPTSTDDNDRAHCSGYYLDGNKLLKCSASNGVVTCPEQSTLGYFVNSAFNLIKPYILCKTSDGSTNVCSELGVPESPADGSSNSCSTGKLINESNKIRLCIGDNIENSVEIFKSDINEYFMKAYYLDETKTGNEYNLMGVSEKAVMPNNIEGNGYFKYEYSFSKNIKLDRNRGVCLVNNLSSSNLIEYKKNEEGNTYIINNGV